MSKINSLMPLRTGFRLSKCDRIADTMQGLIKIIVKKPKSQQMVVDVSRLPQYHMRHNRLNGRFGKSTCTQETHGWRVVDFLGLFLLLLISILIYNL
jgi:hypothetical protein